MNKSPILWHHFCVWKVFIKCFIYDVGTASIEAMMIPLDLFVQRSRCLVAWLGWWIVGCWAWAGCLHAPSHYIMRAMSAAVRCRVHCDIKRNLVQECSSRVQVTGCPPPQWTLSKWWLHPGKTLPISAGSWRWPVTSVQGVQGVQGVYRVLQLYRGLTCAMPHRDVPTVSRDSASHRHTSPRCHKWSPHYIVSIDQHSDGIMAVKWKCVQKVQY